MEGDDRSRLHQIIDELSDDELPVARHLLELLARGLAAPLHQVADIANDDDDAGEDEEEDVDRFSLAREFGQLLQGGEDPADG